MYSSEYLRNKMRAAQRIVSPTESRDAGAYTQVRRNQSAIISTQKGGQMLLLSADGVIATKANAAVCCTNPISQPTVIDGQCCDSQIQYPRGFYGPAKPDCCPINNGPQPVKAPCCTD